jgi:hypothetical protein
MTPMALILRATRIARHLRVNSSIRVINRRRRPSWVWASTKSKLQTWLWGIQAGAGCRTHRSTTDGSGWAVSAALSAPHGAARHCPRTNGGQRLAAGPDPCQPPCRCHSARQSPGGSHNGHIPRPGRQCSGSAHPHRASALERISAFPWAARRSGRRCVR